MNKYTCKELQKLADYLTEKDIHWRNASSVHVGFSGFFIERVHFCIGDERWSAICGMDHGNVVTCGTNAQPIELMICGEEPEGYLKADEICRRIEKEINEKILGLESEREK